jgi:membrane protein DedA with SNARE-associated domain
MSRRILLVLAAVRAVLAIVAIPLAPALYKHHVAVLVLLRPSKEVLLFAGYMVREGKVNVLTVITASIPLLVLAVWVFYGLGRAYRDDMKDADLPGVAGRLLPRERIEQLQDAISDRGTPLIIVGRIASMPSTLVAAAAGSADLSFKQFALADLAGSAISLTMVLGAGFLLGEARKSAGPWLTVLGAVAFLALMIVLGKRLSGAGRTRAREKAASSR